MSKAPLVVDAVLGDLAATLVSTEASTYASIGGVTVTAEQLRKLADKLDKLQAASAVFFDKVCEYTINFRRFQADESVVIEATSPEEAINKFNALYVSDSILSVYNKTEHKNVVEFSQY